MSRKLHAATALPGRKQPLVPIKEEGGWVGLMASLDYGMKDTNLWSYWESNPDPWPSS